MTLGEGNTGPSVQSTGFPSFFLRIIGAIFVGLHMSSAEKNQRRVQGHDILQQPPFNPHTLYATGLAYKWSKIGLIWNLVLLVPTLFAPSVCIWLIGIVDIVFTVYFAIAVALQAQFIPQSSSACQHADTWQVHGNDTESFFHAVAGFNATGISAKEVCEEFVTQRKWGTASLVLFGLNSFSNTFLSLLISMWCVRSVPDKTWLVSSFEVLMEVFMLGLASLKIPAIFLCFIFALQPECIKPPVRFASHFVSRACQTVYTPIWRHLKLLHPRHLLSWRHRPHTENEEEKWNRATPVSGGSSLADFLHVDILTLVSEHLHYQDLVNLSLVSKRLRRTVFPNGHGRSGASMLRRYACNPATRSQCWACRYQRGFSKQQLQKSHEACKPICTPCFYKTIATHRLAYNKVQFCYFCQRKNGKTWGAYCKGPRDEIENPGGDEPDEEGAGGAHLLLPVFEEDSIEGSEMVEMHVLWWGVSGFDTSGLELGAAPASEAA
ncbi:hypothetical protein FQN50_005397 [Emmonsiellopsis sp. PD_5]|nr:hypothetical protein FQN50_005397 [Emmonsiellopsis sp. PD_5]